ncbi:MAG: TolC family protein [Bacteroidota bacterium]
MRKPLFLMMALAFAALNAISQEPLSLSIRDAQDYAMKNGFSVRNARHDMRSAELQTDELIGIGLPQLNGSIQYQNFIDLPTSVVPGEFFGAPGQDVQVQFGVPQQVTAGLTASQLLFDGSWLVGLQASRSYARLKQQQVTKSEADIRREVAESYHLALIALDNVRLLEEGKVVLENMLVQTTALLKEGFAEEQDVDQVRLSLNDWNNRLANGQAQVKLTQDLLKFTIGMPLSTEIRLSTTTKEEIDANHTELLSAAFNPEGTIEYQLAQSGLGMQQLNLKNQKAKTLPNLAAFYNLQTQALRREFNFTDTSLPWFPIQLWGVQLNVPILSGGSRYRSIQKAQVEVQRMTETLAYTREAAQLEYNGARIAYLNAMAVYQSSLDSYQLAQKILMRTGIKFSEGVASSFDVSQATSQSLQAQGSYVQSMLELMNAKTRYQKAINQL